MWDQGRVVVMAVHHPNGRSDVGLRTSYMKPLVTKSLKLLEEEEVEEMLDCLSDKYDCGTIEPLGKVGMVSMEDLGEVHKALEAVATRSQDRSPLSYCYEIGVLTNPFTILLT